MLAYTMSRHDIFYSPISTMFSKGLVVTDVDGCLTDGRARYNERGSISREFSVIDGHGFQMLKEEGFVVIMMSGENDPCIEHRAKKLGVQFISAEKGETKLTRLNKFLAAKGIKKPKDIYVLGDDINDLALRSFSEDTFFATPRGSMLSRPGLNKRVDLILTKRGGDGAFREFAEEILAIHGIAPY